MEMEILLIQKSPLEHFTKMYNLFLSCPPVYHLPGTWTKCEQPLIPHGSLSGLTGDNLIIGAIVLAVFSAVLYGIHVTLGDEK